MDDPTPQPGNARRVLGPITIAFTLGLIGCAALGDPAGLSIRIVSVLDISLSSGWIALVYFLSALGLGRVAWRWRRRGRPARRVA